MSDLSPGLILILGSALIPLFRGHLRSTYMLLLPLSAFALILTIPYGNHGEIELFNLTLTTVRVDGLSLIFSYAFLLAAFLGIIYALHINDTRQQVAALIYSGSAIGAVLAGDLLTLFIFWEGTTVGSAILVFAGSSERAYRAGMRYLVVQIGSGVLLLAGAGMIYVDTGSITFGQIGIETLGGVLILVAFGIKCAFPFLHNWLQDAYPEATVTGTVFLSAFTTKLAVYALARGYPGTEILVPIGVAMTAFPIFFAVIENDLRRVLAYSLNNQLGFMVVGIGIGTELSISGTAAHAFSHVIYKALLFMSMGAVLYRTGTIKGSELGGLYKTMPWTTVFCIVGAASISAFPLFSGFISKALIITAAMKEGYFVTWLILLFASAGVFHHSGIKIPFFAFFAHDSGKRPAEAPSNMLVAMGISAILCIGIGVFPSALYAILPFNVTYIAYTSEHVITQLQLLMFSALAFTVLIRTGIYPPELRSTNLDFDWFYRRLLRNTAIATAELGARARAQFVGILSRQLSRFLRAAYRHHGPTGVLARSWPTGSMAFWATFLLAAYLLLYYF